MTQVRHAAWAGQFYPGKRRELEQTIHSYLQNAEKVEFAGRIIGLVAPHAGYVFSGQTAAVAYKQLENNSYTTVVIMAPSHSAWINGVSAYSGDFYETPLGQVPVATAAVSALTAAANNIHVGEAGHQAQVDRAEHALEVQLPFLQTVLADFEIVPLVFNDFGWENCRSLGEALAATLPAKTTLVVASSDLYHGQSYDECQRSDETTLAGIEQDNAMQFCFSANNNKIMACGAGPITVLKIVAEKWDAQQPQVIARATSADAGGRQDYVVGYAAAIAARR